MARHYLDYGSAAPIRPEVVTQLGELIGHLGADPGRLHAEALVVRDLIEQSREVVAGFFGAAPRQVIFTSGLAESIAMATYGVASRRAPRPVALSHLERSAVLENAKRFGEVVWLPSATTGRLDVAQLEAALSSKPSMAWCQVANHETGILQPLAEVRALADAHGVALAGDLSGALPYQRPDVRVDVAVAAAESFGAPAGTGVLILDPSLRLEPLLTGGAQERGRRAGLENALGICSLAAAVSATAAKGDEERSHLAPLQRQVEAALTSVDGVALVDGGGQERVVNTSCFTVAGVESEAVLIALERRGIAVHSGSACSSEALEPSPVLAAMGLEANHGLRVTTGWGTTEDDVAALVGSFGAAVAELRALRA